MMNVDELEALKAIPDLGKPPGRVVSLVPSMTESLFALGFGATVAGVTDYCIHPAEQLQDLPKVGGPKNPDVEAVAALKPDLVFVNQEENTRQVVEALLDAGLKVWLTFPQTVDEAVDVLRQLLGVYHSDLPAMQVDALQKAVDWARGAAESADPVRYFCPVWQDESQGQTWWMTFNRYTYADSLLSVFGGENIFANRERRRPLAADLGAIGQEKETEGDRRYPRVSVEEVLEASPDLILLPSEPFAFGEEHKESVYNALSGTPAVEDNNVYLVDGSLITWHGSRLAAALQQLPEFFIRN